MAPAKAAAWGDVRFTFGLSVPRDAEVLIVYTRAGWSLPTHLPRNRLAFVAGEPPEIHPYSAEFLKQFARVVVPGPRAGEANRLAENYCLPWFVGIDHANPDAAWGRDDLAALPVPPKDDRISIVTSRKASTPFHRQRLALIDHIVREIPERVVLYGREFNPVGDKAEALLPHRYHLALENGNGPFSWTEKLSDPLLCWALPFYVGCVNVEDELPGDCLIRLDPGDPQGAVRTMVQAVERGAWERRRAALETARARILDHHNTMALFARISTELAARPPAGPAVTIRAEAALPPRGRRPAAWAEFLARRALNLLDPQADLRFARWRQARRRR